MIRGLVAGLRNGWRGPVFHSETESRYCACHSSQSIVSRREDKVQLIATPPQTPSRATLPQPPPPRRPIPAKHPPLGTTRALDADSGGTLRASTFRHI